MSPPLRALDLFSGIGGLSHALTGVIRPVAYCDIEEVSQRVLEDAMQKSRIPRAPICKDVKGLDTKWLRSQSITRLESVCAGFPCVGFSLAGNREGFDQEGSGLFREILRIVDEVKSIKYLFLENVGVILRDGMDHLTQELAAKRGFDLAWVVTEAREVGAPQRRKRWFCIATKRGAPPLGPPPPFEMKGYRSHLQRWLHGEPKHRTLCVGGRADPPMPVQRNARRRMFLLGNGVVPDQARHSYLHLMGLLHERRARAKAVVGGREQQQQQPTGNLAPAGDSIALRMPPEGRALKRDGNAWPKCGTVTRVDGKLRVLARPRPTPRHWRAPMPLRLDSALYRPPRGIVAQNVLEPVGKIALDYWSTPRAGMTHASHAMTRRTMKDLPTQVRHAVDTPGDERRCGVLDPTWVEWLQGVDRDWTRAATSMK